MNSSELKDKTRVITFRDVMEMTGFSKSYLSLIPQHYYKIFFLST